MLGYDSNYVPGWDCHGLPIEWKIEEQYRAKGKDKDEVAIVEFRRECRAFAEHWIDVQREEFKRLGVEGDWEHPYATMDFRAEAQIAREIMKFATTDQLYRGSKPVMWSSVERTALAEAEVEYHEKTSPTVVGEVPDRSQHPRRRPRRRRRSSSGRRRPGRSRRTAAIAYRAGIDYGLYASPRRRGQLGQGRRALRRRRQARRRGRSRPRGSTGYRARQGACCRR